MPPTTPPTMAPTGVDFSTGGLGFGPGGTVMPPLSGPVVVGSGGSVEDPDELDDDEMLRERLLFEEVVEEVVETTDELYEMM